MFLTIKKSVPSTITRQGVSEHLSTSCVSSMSSQVGRTVRFLSSREQIMCCRAESHVSCRLYD